MQMHTFTLGVLALAFVAGCKNKQELPATTASAPAPAAEQAPADPQPAPESAPTALADAATEDGVFFYLERTPCFGSCPTFKITVFQDGHALYEGRRFAPREGRYTATVTPAAMQQIKAAVEAAGFYRMEDKYDKPVTDLPSLIIRIHADRGDKRVIGRVGAPQAFKALGQDMEKLLDGLDWTKAEDAEH